MIDNEATPAVESTTHEDERERQARERYDEADSAVTNAASVLRTFLRDLGDAKRLLSDRPGPAHVLTEARDRKG